MGTSTNGARPCHGDEAGSTEDAAHKRRRTVQGSAATRGRTDKPRVTVIGSLPQRAGRAQTDCESLGLKVHANFLAACREYRFPGSHQVGSFGPKGRGIVRTYSNGTPGKDLVLASGMIMLYRLKDEATRAQFAVNLHRRRPVRVFRKISRGVVELGDFYVTGFEPIQPGDEPSFGPTFVRFERVDSPALSGA